MGSAVEGFALLNSAAATPIAQLNPDLPDQETRAVRGQVTVVWPYSSVANTFAFVLAEPDAVLRSAKGQVRVQLRGSSAKKVAAWSIGPGDSVVLLLEGVHWEKDVFPARVPGSRVDWQLGFAERLKVEARINDSEFYSADIDHPHPDTPPESAQDEPGRNQTTPPLNPSPPPAELESNNLFGIDIGLFRTPAYLKRARPHYDFFEESLDLFQEDGGIYGKGRKRARFGQRRKWRYSSLSQSPEPESCSPAAPDVAMIEAPRQPMVDEGCQTLDFDPPQVDVAAPAAVEDKNGPPEERQERQDRQERQEHQEHHEHLEQQQQTQASPSRSDSSTPTHNTEPEPPPHNPVADLDRSHTLFGNLSSSHESFTAPQFGTTVTGQTDDGLGISDRVRFGFSHQPHPELFQAPDPESMPPHSTSIPSYSYPEPPSRSPPRLDMETYTDAAEQEHELEPSFPYGIPQAPPLSESFERGQWDMATQSHEYNSIEGGHFGTDALHEGRRITTEEAALRSDPTEPDQVPAGFASYGGHEEGAFEDTESSAGSDANSNKEDEPGASSGEDEGVQPAGVFVENEEAQSETDDEVGVDAEDDTQYDQSGEVVEQGDYDQRQYDSPSDDDEGLDEEEDQVEEEVADRYGRQDTLGDDEEGYSDEEASEGGEEADYDDYASKSEGDEGGYGEDDYEDEEDENGYQPWVPSSLQTTTTSSFPPAPQEPVVINLLSDSEDEDEEPALPSPPAEREHHVQEASHQQPEPEEPPSTRPTLEPETAVPQQASTPSALHSIDANTKPSQDYSQFDISTADDGTREADWDYAPHAGQLSIKAETDITVLEEGGGPPENLSSARIDRSSAGAIHTSSEMGDEGEDGYFEEDEEHMMEERDQTASHPRDATGPRQDETGAPEPQPPPRYAESNAADDPASVPTHSPQADTDTLHQTSEEQRFLSVQQEPAEDQGSSMDVDSPTREPDVIGSQPTAVFPFEPQEDTSPTIAPQHNEETDTPHSPPSPPAVQEQINPISNESQSINSPDSAQATSNEQVEQFPTSARPEMIESFPSEVERANIATLNQDNTTDHEITAQFEQSLAEVAGQGQYQMSSAEMQESIQMQFRIPNDTQESMQHDREMLMEDAPDYIEEKHHLDGGSSRFVEHRDSAPEEMVEAHLESVEMQEALPSQHYDELMGMAYQDARDQDQTLQEELRGTIQESSDLGEERQLEENDTTGPSQVQEPQVREEMQEETQDFGSDIEMPDSDDLPAAGEVEAGHDEDRESTPPEHNMSSEVTYASANEDSEMLMDSIASASTEAAVAAAKKQLEDQEQEAKSQGVYQSSPPPEKEEDVVITVKPPKTRQRAQCGKLHDGKDHDENPLPNDQEGARGSTQGTASQQARAAATPKKAAPNKILEPIRSSRVTRAMSGGSQKSATPEPEDSSSQLSKAALTSPSRHSVTENESQTPATLKAELTKRLRADLPQYISLKNIKSHQNKHVSVTAVVTTQPPAPQRAKRQYTMSFHVTDQTFAPTHVAEVQFSHAHKDALPSVRPGDAIVLRAFEVVSLAKKGFGLRTGDESAWAVYNNDEGPAEIKGAAMELDQVETDYAVSLRAWYKTLDEVAQAKLDKANQKLADEGPAK